MTAQPAEDRNPDNERVSRNIRAELARISMTQAELAGALAPARERMWVSDRLNGRADWRVTDVTAVARAIGCTPEVLLNGLADAVTIPTTTED
jgi:hypothetical protein